MSIQYSVKGAERFLSLHQREMGWGYTIYNQQSFVEPSSWCWIFLHKVGNVVDKELETLLSYQNDDGGWPNIFAGPSDIRTANALLVLGELDTNRSFKAQQEAGLKWLAECRKSNGGWSWCDESWNFTEPTSLAILALYACNFPITASCKDFILKHQCKDGGWNSHAPFILGQSQVSTPNVTSWALIALKYLGSVDQDPAIQNGLLYVIKQIVHGQLSSPYTLALCLRTLVLYDADYDVQEQAARRLTYLQDRDGGWLGNIHWTAIAGIALIEYQRDKRF